MNGEIEQEKERALSLSAESDQRAKASEEKLSEIESLRVEEKEQLNKVKLFPIFH